MHRSVVFHVSPGPLALQLGIIRKTTRRGGSLMIGTDEGEYYSLRSFDASVHTTHFQALHAMGVLLNSLPVPRTNVEWAQAQADAEALAERLNIKRSQYRWPWLLRTYLFVEMRHHGVKMLKIVADWTSEQLQQAIRPDQNEWLRVWMSGLAEDSLKKLLKKLRFTESLEMLSIYACVLNDSAIMGYPIEQMREFAYKISRARRQMRRQQGQEANPVLVLQSVMDAL